MLKLPKGLKKKKKGKKSKKDQELFTEEELEQYKREHKLKQNEGISEPTTSEGERKPSLVDSSSTSAVDEASIKEEEKSEQNEEWSKFKALTAGVDSILHRTQDDLDRIKSSSFYQKVPTAVEKQKLEEEEAAAREAEKLEKERLKKLEEEANRDKLAEAVVELSESEEESEDGDDIFNTEYIDAITSGEVQLTIVPDSPILENNDGEDPFDTSYADRLIKGPEVSKRGKKLVSLGSAVEVLTGRVDGAHAVAVSGAKRKPRKGVQDLLFENEEDVVFASEEFPVTPEPPKTLLDDLDDDIPDAPIDLSISLHVSVLQQQKEQIQDFEPQVQKINTFNADVVSEFDVLKDDEDDEFAELAVESLTKKEDIKVLTYRQTFESLSKVESDWAEFEKNEENKESDKKVKPPRPPPARPSFGPHISKPENQQESDNEFNIPGDDPFDTAYVEKVIAVKQEEDDDDFDFDPRAGEEKNSLLSVQKDLLAGSSTDLSGITQSPIIPIQESVEEIDPFDTSAVENLVKPKAVELKFLEKELLSDQKIRKSLSDPDFDPRAEEPQTQQTPVIDFEYARRKSSLSLNINSKSVGFLVPDADFLSIDNECGKIQKPLTPYYAKPEVIEEKDIEDPFDTSFVPSSKPSDVELKHIENDLLSSTYLEHSLSDPDFDPRADDKVKQSDLLAVEDNINIKVLTPAHETKTFFSEDIKECLDPFDTSIALNIQPGKIELKLIEKELIPRNSPDITTGVLDTLTDAQELGLGDKVLTPQIPVISAESIEEIDPFDTSFASNIGPGETEIKIIENELIRQ